MSIIGVNCHQILRFTPNPNQFSRQIPSLKPPVPKCSLIPKTPKLQTLTLTLTPKSHQTHHSNPQTSTQDDGIPIEDVKILAKFKSRYNYIRVIEVSRKADHPFAGSRLLLLDSPGNIHSISFLFKTLTTTYFDVFATLPPILPPGPLGILGFGAGSAAKILLELHPELVIHGWEIDPCVVDVGRKYFGLGKMEKDYPNRVFVNVGDALKASVRDGFSGIVVDLFAKGSVIPELQDPKTWVRLKNCLRKGGRIMVNVGGSCVEAEDLRRDGRVVMKETLRAMREVFGHNRVWVLSLGNRKDDSSVALTGEMPDVGKWKAQLHKPLKGYVDMWTSSRG